MSATQEEPLRLSIANGALLEAPLYEEHRRGTNWMAIIDIDGTSPGGLSRRFLNHARGECFYMLEQLSLFDPVEFGADYTTSFGNKKRGRWYGVVVAKTDDFILVQRCASGSKAVLFSKEKRVDPNAQRTALLVERQQLLDRAEKLRQELETIDAPVSSTQIEIS
jgi:hypothetical protein